MTHSTPEKPTWVRAIGIGVGVSILAVLFPLVGWGFAGLAISPKLIVVSAVPHILFGLLLWGLDRYLAKPSHA